jgi:hypothetical protein
MDRFQLNISLLAQKISNFLSEEKASSKPNKVDSRLQLSYTTDVDTATFAKIAANKIQNMTVISLHKIVSVIGGKMEDFIIDNDKK